VPIVAEKQVCVLYAGVRGFLDKIQTTEIAKFEKLFLDHLETKFPHITETIRTEKALSD
jgi:F0F1-type ATP synthase alpha subunit